MRKKRGYNRDTPEALLRDYKLFAIACEGGKREPHYFSLFQHISQKVSVDIIEDIVSDEEMQSKYENRSAPKWVLDRAVKYIEKEGLSDDDDLWFVMDKDRWSDEQLREIAEHCNDNRNWHVVISNPCFEVWLYFHKKANILNSKAISCNDFKNEISKFEKGGYHPFKFIQNIYDAIENAKESDSDPNHFLPKTKETKVYQLVETLLKFTSKKDFEIFIKNKLPLMVNSEKEKAKNSIRKSNNK